MDDDILVRLRYTTRVCNHRWNLGPAWNIEPPECESCIRQREAANEIERLRLVIDQFCIAEREHWIATKHPGSMTATEIEEAIRTYNAAIGKIRQLSYSRYK